MRGEAATEGRNCQKHDTPGPPAGSLPVLIKAEIRSMRKGRGIWAARLDQRLGPHLLELVADTGDDTESTRRALVGVLHGAAAGLPDDVRTAIDASLALSGETLRMDRFKDRVSWLAQRIGRLDRTALRRIEEAERLLAEEIAGELLRRRGSAALPQQAWYLDELRTLLRMDTATPESHEHRRIVATNDGVREVMAWLDVPGCDGKPRPSLDVEVMYGGRLVRREEPLTGRLQFVIRLPNDLRAGDQHEYGLILRVSPEHPMRSHYVFTPECRCDAFQLRIRFGPERRPTWIRRVAGETVRMFDNAGPRGDLVALDSAGELTLNFVQPIRYLGYGAQWNA